MKVRTPASSLTRRIYPDSFGCSHQPDQGPFRQDLPATYTRALRYMLDSFSRSFSHLCSRKLLLFPIPFCSTAFVFFLCQNHVAIGIVG